jgi:hypothetical protein
LGLRDRATKDSSMSMPTAAGSMEMQKRLAMAPQVFPGPPVSVSSLGKGGAMPPLTSNQPAPGSFPIPPLVPVQPAVAPKDDPAFNETVRTELAAAYRLQYAYQHANGAAEARFDTGSSQTSYRVILLGHTPDGSFGTLETHLDVWKDE